MNIYAVDEHLCVGAHARAHNTHRKRHTEKERERERERASWDGELLPALRAYKPGLPSLCTSPWACEMLGT